MGDKIPTVEEHSGDDSNVRYRMLYDSNGRVYTRKISGFYQMIRRYTGLPLIAHHCEVPSSR